MNLKIIGERKFSPGEAPFDVFNWNSYEFGLYDVTHYPGSKKGDLVAKQDRILMYWGTDENYPNQGKIVICMPFPSVSVVNAADEKPQNTEMYPVNTGIDVNVLLKAIAIAQDPKLALELI